MKKLQYILISSTIALLGIVLIGIILNKNILNNVGAIPNINILGNYAVVGTGLNATTTANAHLTASGTIAFVSLGSSGNPCLTIGTDGTIATSTCGSGITSFNGSTSSTQTMTLTGATGGFGWTTSNGVHTLNIATSTGSATGLLPSADWTTFNNKQATITDGTGLTFTGATLNCDTASASVFGCLTSADWTTFNNKQATISAGSNIVITGASIAVSSTPSFTTLNGYIPSRLAKQHIQWSVSFTTSTNAWYDPIFVFDSTSTILKVWENSTSTGNTLNYNLFYGDTNAASSSMYKVFSSDRTIGSLLNPTSTATFASSTPCAGCGLFIYQSNASSTLTTLTIFYEEQ